MLLEVPEKLQDTELTTQIVDVLAKLTQKEFYDEAVLRFQHAQALDCLAKLRMAIRSIKGTSPSVKSERLRVQRLLRNVAAMTSLTDTRPARKRGLARNIPRLRVGLVCTS